MNITKTFLVIFGLILVQFNLSNALKCKIGFGLSSRTSDTVTYNYEDTTTDCTLGVASSSNPAVQPRGCYKKVWKLSDGVTYVEKGCIQGTASGASISSTELAINGYNNFDSKVFNYICNTDNCNSSNNLKISVFGLAFSLLFCFFAFF